LPSLLQRHRELRLGNLLQSPSILNAHVYRLYSLWERDAKVAGDPSRYHLLRN